jgi:hypothetical protein
VLRELTDDERVAYFRGVQPIWGGGLDEARFVLFQRRLADSQEAARRYVLLGWFERGRLCSGMKAYELHGSHAGTAVTLLGVGAVFTPPALRRHGHAAEMLRAAHEHYAARGFHGAVLFSDIDVHYYEKLGYRVLESREALVELPELPSGASFRAAAPSDAPEMIELFTRSRAHDRRLMLSRDGWTLKLQLRRLRELARARGVGEPEWGIVASDGAAMFRHGRDSIDVLDAAWTSPRGRDGVLSGLRDAMVRSGRSLLRFWPAHQLRSLFPAQERMNAIAMVAPLNGTPMPEAGAPAELSLLDHI